MTEKPQENAFDMLNRAALLFERLLDHAGDVERDNVRYQKTIECLQQTLRDANFKQCTCGDWHPAGEMERDEAGNWVCSDCWANPGGFDRVVKVGGSFKERDI